MHEYKKFKGRKVKSASIDGIISDGRRLGLPAAGLSTEKAKMTEVFLGATANRPEGFHPMRATNQSLGILPDAPSEIDLNTPIILDEPVKKKSRFRRTNKKPGRRATLKRAGLALLVLVLVAGGYLGFKLYQTQKHVLSGGGQAPAVCDGNVPVSQLKKEGDSRVNILLLGIGGGNHEAPDLTDTIIVASLDPVNDKLVLLSVPRDLWVKIPGNGQERINAAFEYGKMNSDAKGETELNRDGVDTADQVLETVLGIPIHYHALINFKAFESMVNALGGVDVNVTKEGSVYEVLWIEGTSLHYTLNVQPGLQHFDGNRALYYARSRQTSARGDFDRGERQRTLIAAIKDKAFSVGTFSNPIKVSNLLDSLGNNVYTDFDSGSIKCLYKQISEVPSANITSLDLVTPPHDLLVSGSIPGRSTLAPKAGLFSYDAINDYVHSALRDSFLEKENAKTAIYNATNIAGLATTKANLLKSYGYNITTVDSTKTATNPAKSIIVDLSKGRNKYTKNYLEIRFGVRVVTSIPASEQVTPPVDTDFVIILGQDATSSSQN